MGNHDILFSFIFQIWRRSSRPPLTPPRLRRGSRWSWGVTRPGGSQGRRCIGQGEVFRTYLNYFSFWTMDIFKGIFSVVNIFKNLSSLFQISVRGLLFNFLCTSMQSVTSILKFFLETGLLYFPLSFTFYAQDLFVFFRKGNSLRGRLGFPFFLAYNPCFIKKQGARISIF